MFFCFKDEVGLFSGWGGALGFLFGGFVVVFMTGCGGVDAVGGILCVAVLTYSAL